MFKAEDDWKMAVPTPAPAAAPGLTQPDLLAEPAPWLPETDGDLTE